MIMTLLGGAGTFFGPSSAPAPISAVFTERWPLISEPLRLPSGTARIGGTDPLAGSSDVDLAVALDNRAASEREDLRQ